MSLSPTATAKDVSESHTLPWLFETSVQRFSSNPFMWEKHDGTYEATTYAAARTRVHQCAGGFIALGLRPGDRVALISEGRNDWVVAELGILYAGAINVPLSVKLDEPADLRFRLAHAGCRMAVVSGNQAQKVISLRSDLPNLETIIHFDPPATPGSGEIAFESLVRQGVAYLEQHAAGLEERWRSVKETDIANICYTSGTVADPKGVLLSHRNYTANVAQGTALYPLPEHFVTLLILPWDHAFAHTCGVYAVAATGSSFASVETGKTPMETLRNIPVNIREVRPTFLMSVPALAKNFRKGIEAGIRAKGPVAGALFAAGLATAYAYNADGWTRGKGWRSLLALPVRLFDAVLFSKIRENFGGRMQYFVGGGALLDIELQRFFAAIGMPMYQGYGLTEASPVISSNTPARHKFGSSGQLVPDMDLKICDEQGNALPPGRHGEIVIRGGNVTPGYWMNEKATAATVRDGWLFTGDLGFMDADGFLHVLGREKSLLIGHDGEKYSPEGIEETIVDNSPYIDQLMLHNSQSPFTVGLAVLNTERVRHWLKHHHHDIATDAGCDAVLRLIQHEIDAYRPNGKHGGEFPERWLPAALGILPEPFTEQNRFLNSTLKMVRGRIVQAYADRLAELYQTGGKEICSAGNRAVIRSLMG
jgi:long-chain acyl-CoA synthetase